MSYEQIKSYYDRRLWNIEWLKKICQNGYITKEQFNEITGEQLPDAEKASEVI